MPSSIYECQVMHRRLYPKVHGFVYRIFLLAIDLDELDALHRRLALFSVNRANLYAFHERDYLPLSEPLHRATPGRPRPRSESPSLKERVVRYLEAHQVDLDGGRVVLVTLPRIAGYLFNPVSFYFCYDRSGRPAAAIAEVTNTFREVKPYFLGTPVPGGGEARFHLRTPKHFYVSPYSDVDVQFDFKLTAPGARLAARIDDHAGTRLTLTSTVAGRHRELSNARLAWVSVRYPLLTLRIIGLIHWQALLLWWRRVPWFAKGARSQDQRDLFRPDSSLAPPHRPAAEPQAGSLAGTKVI